MPALTLLAYLCWPEPKKDAHTRSHFLKDIHSVGLSGQPRTRRVQDFATANRSRFRDGQHAGNFVLTACQLYKHGVSPTYQNVARAIAYYRKTEQFDSNPPGAEREAYLAAPHLVSRHDALSDQLKRFRLVAHIWAAFVWAAQDAESRGLDPIQYAIGSFDATASLMGRASVVASYAACVQRKGRDHGPLLDPDTLWWADIPLPAVGWYFPKRMEPALFKALQA